MSDAIFARLTVAVPAPAFTSWERITLAPQRARLLRTKGFAALDMGDEDLLGWEMTVEGARTLDEALSIARGFVEKKDVARWAHFVNDAGKDAVRVEQDGPLAREATAADLLALLARTARDGDLFLEVDVDRDAGTASVRGVLPEYDTYRIHRLPWLYALAGAAEVGGRGSLTFLGEAEGEFVATLADLDGTRLSLREEDPQNLTEDDWNERLGDLEEAHRAWTKAKPKKHRRGR
jgi:hypothetical protein